jgi:hypothetical protein
MSSIGSRTAQVLVHWLHVGCGAGDAPFERSASNAAKAVLVLGLLSGCQQQMADQPSYKPLDECDFFADGRSARPLVPGTVPRGYLRTDTALWTGRRVAERGEQDPDRGIPQADLRAATQPEVVNTAADAKARYAEFVDTFPFPITERIVEHGYGRYMIYCVVCHDPLGTGHGRIVDRGYTQPPSYHIERLRKAPVGHLFAVVSEGYGSMPSYRSQIPMHDRWAIVAYLRALQSSQHYPAEPVGGQFPRKQQATHSATRPGGKTP